MQIVNLAHGSYYLIGGYIGLAVVNASGNFWLALCAATAAMALLGFVMWQIALRHYVANELGMVLLTFGFLLLLGDLALANWGGAPQTLPAPYPFDGAIEVGSLRFPAYRVALLIAGLASAGFLWWLIDGTRTGVLIRATVNDAQMAEGLGVNVSRITSGVFSLSAGLAGMAGVLGGPLIGVYPGADLTVLLLAIVVVVLGGLGSLKGAFLASLIVGLLDTAARSFFPQASLFAVFAPMALILIIKPSGLMGRS